MAEITMLSAGSALPSLGSLLGTGGTQELVQHLNRSNPSSVFFGSSDDRFAHYRTQFMDTVLQPIYQASNVLQKTYNEVVNNDYIHPITSEEDLAKGIPSCMHEIVLTHEPIRHLHRQGRIDAWGYQASEWKDKPDRWGRLIENGEVDIMNDEPNEDGEYVFCYTYRPGDPDHSVEDLYSAEATREFLEELIDTTEYDPTDYPSVRG